MRRFGCWMVRPKPDPTIDRVVEKYWRRREISTEFADSLSNVGGGGGSRTRVRKRVVVGLYMRVRFCFLVSGVRKRPKTAGDQARNISRSRAEPPRDRQPA